MEELAGLHQRTSTTVPTVHLVGVGALVKVSDGFCCTLEKMKNQSTSSGVQITVPRQTSGARTYPCRSRHLQG
eukprot:308385-Amphidinium_carterae.3